MFEMKNTLSVLESKPWKELKYISENWKDHSYNDASTITRYGNPQQEYPETSYFSQSVSYEPFWNAGYEAWKKVQTEEWPQIPRDAESYDNWAKLSKSIWFDTQGCMKGRHRGDINKGNI